MAAFRLISKYLPKLTCAEKQMADSLRNLLLAASVSQYGAASSSVLSMTALGNVTHASTGKGSIAEIAEIYNLLMYLLYIR